MFFATILFGCQEKQVFVAINPDSFSSFCKDDYRISEGLVKQELNRLLFADKDREVADKKARNYYFNDNPFLWITRNGVSSKADSVLKYIATVGDFGFDPDKFCYNSIAEDLQLVRRLNFNNDKNSVSKALARLEYHLTKAYLRYCVGQSFGYVNPSDILNRLDVRDSDSISVTYHNLFDIPIQKANKDFFSLAFSKIKSDSVGIFMQMSHPDNPVYNALLKGFQANLTQEQRTRYLCNLERSRWRLKDAPWQHEKYVLINLPSMHLEAFGEDESLSMRIGVGSQDTKTPLLTSQISRIDFNPQWVIPKSIIKKSILPHVGDVSYFDRHNYFVMERKTGKSVPVEYVTSSMLLSKDYSVVQRGGKGNPLGSVIFRFDNNFSVYIHYTSNPDVFMREDRSVSHGCIRVEKPYDLAMFLLEGQNDDIAKKIEYTMNLYTTECRNEQEFKPDQSLLLRSLKVNPMIPLYITYYTLYPDRNGVLQTYKDIYGFDEPIFQHLQSYL